MHPRDLNLSTDRPGTLDQQPANPVRANNTLVIPTERLSISRVLPQVKLMTQLLPPGSLSIIFCTRGHESIWNRIPGPDTFSSASHQMSLPRQGELGGVFDRIPGLNMVLLTTTPSPTTAPGWHQPFPYELFGLDNMPETETPPTLLWGALHQIGHCLCLPPCWEYESRTRQLLSLQELYNLTQQRWSALAEWFELYNNKSKLDPKLDTSAYLYEIKIVQRAISLGRSFPDHPVKAIYSQPWFQGLHFDQICQQIGWGNLPHLARGLTIMQDYRDQIKSGGIFDPIKNAWTFSTDFGTHPTEEVIVEMLALYLQGKLKNYPQMSQYCQTVMGYWERWKLTTQDMPSGNLKIS